MSETFAEQEFSSPVNAERTQAEDSDSHRRFLDERHQLTDVHAKGPVLCDQLRGNEVRRLSVTCINTDVIRTAEPKPTAQSVSSVCSHSVNPVTIWVVSQVITTETLLKRIVTSRISAPVAA